MEPEAISKSVQDIFEQHIKRLGRRGVLGAARFSDVYSSLMPVQQERLREICGSHFDELLQNGLFVSLALAYNEEAIAAINGGSNKTLDIESSSLQASQQINKLFSTTF